MYLLSSYASKNSKPAKAGAITPKSNPTAQLTQQITSDNPLALRLQSQPETDIWELNGTQASRPNHSARMPESRDTVSSDAKSSLRKALTAERRPAPTSSSLKQPKNAQRTGRPKKPTSRHSEAENAPDAIPPLSERIKVHDPDGLLISSRLNYAQLKYRFPLPTSDAGSVSGNASKTSLLDEDTDDEEGWRKFCKLPSPGTTLAPPANNRSDRSPSPFNPGRDVLATDEELRDYLAQIS